jgi:bleomycin hydrolase
MSFLQNRIGQYHLAVAQHPHRKAELLAQAHAELDGILEAYVGKPPAAFTYEGVRYSGPLDFAQKFLPRREEPVLMMVEREPVPEALAQAKRATGSNRVAGGRGRKSTLAVPIERLEKSIVDSLRKGQSVPFSTEMAREFIDKKSGIMSLSAFHTPPGFAPAPFTYRRDFDISGGGHLMAIVGADLDESGHVIKFKVKNSWGAESGDRGFYHMYEDYFRTYAKSAYIR